MSAMARGHRRIGIIGASGAVGRVVTEMLAGTDDATLVLAGRRITPELVPLRDRLPAAARFETTTLDVLDARALARFADGLSLIVNCAGPSCVIGDRVARTALAAQADYLDPGGYDPLAHALQASHDQATARGLRLIFNAGLFPGLSGVFPAFLAASFPDGADRLECAYVGTDWWSPASALDIIDSLGDFGARRAAGYLCGRAHKAVPFHKAVRRLDPGAGLPRTLVGLIHAEEIVRLATAKGIPTALVWGGNHGRMSGLVLAGAKLLALHRGRRRRLGAARVLAWASATDARSQPPAFVILCTLDGVRDGRPTRVSGRMQVGDTYLATGRIAGLAAQMLLSPGRIAPGVAMLHEAVVPEAFLAALRPYGYDWSTTATTTSPESIHAFA